ncbi:MAG: serine/threonine protein kinase [Deltaproteobacteria bacterium]|nr:serine/threonine protein kinase [Deltaproteobacteria bacterium]
MSEPLEISTADTIALQTHWRTVGLAPDGIEIRTDGTLMPTRQELQTRDEHALRTLPPLRIAHSAHNDQEGIDLTLGAAIGEGGMGLVRTAEQVALGREVAVKTVRQELRSSGTRQGEATLALLREAWVTGQLEHPAVVPVHTLGRDDEGAPLLVMKRIVGRSWAELLADPTLLPEEARADPLRYHLEVLIAVCNAIAFAHSRRVLHRDIKPDNVMIGAFGEVYVLDWGLAVALPDGDPRLPSRSEIRGIAGTPHFMAPEMVAVEVGKIDERTDVYLLGATLHLLLTGTPRHAGRTAMEILAAAWRSPPYGYDLTIPEELGTICNRATAADPAARFADVPTFRAALTAYLQHRHSLEVTRRARGHLDRLGRLLDALGEEDPLSAPTLDATTAAMEIPSDENERLAAIASAFSAARFGFALALESWPGNLAAQQGHEQALNWMFDHEIARGDLHAAQMIAAELQHPDPSVQTRLEALQAATAEQAANAAARERALRDMDRRYGTRTRAFLALIIGVLFGAQALAGGAMVRAGQLQWRASYSAAVALAFVFLLLGFGRWARETLNATDFNRRVVRALHQLALLNVAMVCVLWLAETPPLTIMAWQMLLFAGFGPTLGASLDPKIAPSGLGYFAGFAWSILAPQWSFEAMALGHITAGAWTTWAWRPERLKGDYTGNAHRLRDPPP